MSFASHGIVGGGACRDKEGRRIFDVPEYKAREVAARGNGIVIVDFEDSVTINGKGDKCIVLYQESGDGELRKFITSSTRVVSKLRAAREMEENDGKVIFPCDTRLFEVRMRNGSYTYDIE